MAEPSPQEIKPETPHKIWKRVLFNRWFLTAVITLTIYAAAGFLLLPWLFPHYLSKFAAENLKRKASIAKVHINPFLFKFDAIGFKLEETDGRPIVGFDRLFVDFELSSLFRWAWTFAEIQIEKPSVYMEIGRDGRLNFQKIFDDIPKSDSPTSNPAADRTPPRLLVKNAGMINGIFSFSDHSVSVPVTKIFKSLNLEFKDISTLPEQKSPYVLKATLPEGGSIAWQGDISLHPIHSEGEVSISGFALGTAWEFAQDHLNIEAPTGEIELITRYRFGYQNSMASLSFQNGKISLNGLSLTEKGKDQPMLSLSTLDVDEVSFDLQTRELLIQSITVKDGGIEASVDEKGMVNWQNIIVSGNSGEKTGQNNNHVASDIPPWRLKAQGADIENLSVDYTDRSHAKPIAVRIGGLNVFFKSSAEVGGGQVKAVVDGLKVELNNISLSEIGKERPVIDLDSVALDDGQIDVNGRSIALTRLTANGGKTIIVRDKDGTFPLIDFVIAKETEKTDPGIGVSDSKAESERESWAFRLGALELNNHQVNLQIENYSPSIVYDFKNIYFGLKNISNDGKRPIDFETKLDVAQGGHAAFSGRFSQSVDEINATVEIAGISLIPLRPLLTEFTYLTLKSGDVSASSKVAYRLKKSGPQIHVDGNLNVDRLKLNETKTGERFLEWKSMSANKIKLDLLPNQLQILGINLVEPGAKITIYKDHSVNLAKILKPADEPATLKKEHPEPPPAEESKETKSEFPVNIERIRIKKGIVDFSDFSLVLPFATRIIDFNGVATGISSAAASRATLKFEGRVGDFGSSSVQGSLKPFAPKMFTDLAVVFNNVEMIPLSPYSATFAGRKIASGRLNLNLEYKIENSELLGENSVILEKFTLGERVEAPSAINLPLDLAIALLKDAEGKIDIALPVRGNMDNPEFKYGVVVRKAIINLIKKIVTSPFRALGGLFGGEQEQMDAVSFQPASDRIQPSELEKLQKVAEALKQRPQLKLRVQGRFDSKIDGEAMRKKSVNRAIVEQIQETKISSDEEPEMITFDNAKTQRALEKRLEIVGGKKAFDEFKIQYEKETGKKPEPVKSYMAIFGKESSDTDFYRALFQELVGLEPLNEDDLIELGNRRSEAIVNVLTAVEGLDNARVTAGSTGPVENSSVTSVDTKLSIEAMTSGL